MDSKFLFIGNGKGALNLKERINDYDIIVRFNNRPLNKDVGHRTDMMINNDKNIRVLNFLKSPSENSCTHFVKYYNTGSNNVIMKKLAKVKQQLLNRNSIITHLNIPGIFEAKFIEKYSPIPLNKHPTTGLVALLYFTHRNFDCTVIGFDNLTEIACNLRNDHYFENKHRAASSHDWKQEQEIFKLLNVKVLK